MAPCVLNAANEVAVEAFLEGALPFAGIPAVVEAPLEEAEAPAPSHFADLFDCDADARTRARARIVSVAASIDATVTNGAGR